MSALDLTSELDESHITQISQTIGADPAQTRKAIEAASPLLVAGVAQTAQQPQGQQTVQQAMDSHAGLLGNLGQILGAGGNVDFGGILDQVLGRNKPDVENGVQETSGLNGDQTKKLLAILAPIVVAMLAKRRQQAGAKPLDTHLREEAQQAHEQAQRRSPQVGGILGKILSYAEAPKQR